LEEELSGVQDDEAGQSDDDDLATGKAKGKGKGKRTVWNIKGEPPVLSAATARPVVWLSYATTSPDLQYKLKQLLIGLSDTSPVTASEPSQSGCQTSPSMLPLANIPHKCAALEMASVVNDFHQMLSYIDFAIYYES
jgi:hypothetical protein